MRRLLLLLVLLLPSASYAQTTLTAAGVTCLTTGACLVVAVANGQGAATFTVLADASANTVQFEASTDSLGLNDPSRVWFSLNATPSNSATAASSASAIGVWQANVAGYTAVRIRESTLVSGTTTVNITISSASARSSGSGGGGGTTNTIASGTAVLGTSSISSAACAAVVTVAGAGVQTTDNIEGDFNADPTAVVGYTPSASGMLTIIKYPTAGNVNFKVCNNTSGAIIPGAITLNWRVVR